jgi:hypothetical protein
LFILFFPESKKTTESLCPTTILLSLPVFLGTLTFRFGWFIAWPAEMSYSSWQSLLKSALWFIGINDLVRPFKPKNKRKISRRYRRFLLAKERQKEEIVEQRTKAIITSLETLESTKDEGVKNEIAASRQ